MLRPTTASMADPTLLQWGQNLLTGTITGGVMVAGLKGMFKILVADRIKRAEDEKDEYKRLWKQSVQSRRSIRRELEAEELGAASVPPPSDEEYDDETGVYAAMDRQDRAWERERTGRTLDVEPPPIPPLKLPKREEKRLERYAHGDPLSTPPEPVPRKKFPSRPR
jgi:hypothetical protein